MKDLKGHVKVTLRDAKTGQIDQIIEGDNIVTDAVKNLLANNILGCVDYTKIYPIWSRWFKGCLCFQNAFPEVDGHPDPTKCFIPDESVNPCVAHAGDTTPQDFADDLKRGSPNTHVQVVTRSSIKLVWEWSPRQGNSQNGISAIALTHKDIGNCGTGSTSTAFRNLQPFDLVQTSLSDVLIRYNAEQNVYGQYDGNHAWWFYIGEPNDWTDSHTAFSTNKITLCLKRLGFDQLGLYDSPDASNEFDIHYTLTLNDTLYCNPAYYIDGHKLHLFSNITGFDGNTLSWNNTVKHWTITWDDPDQSPTYTYETISTGRSDLAPLTLDYKCGYQQTARPVVVSIPHGKLNGNDYWFFPCSDNAKPNYNDFIWNVKGLVRCGGGSTKYIPYYNNQPYFKNSMHGDELCPVVMSGCVVNGSHGFTCQDQLAVTNPWYVTSWPITTPEAVSSYCMPIGSGSLNNYYYSRYILVNKFLTTTRFNLPSTVYKTASQSMTIEYTITEV